MAHPFAHGLGLKALAVALAVLLRLAVAGDPVVERGFRIPLEFENLPGAVEILGDAPDTVVVMPTDEPFTQSLIMTVEFSR